jgi:hypothetical protein
MSEEWLHGRHPRSACGRHSRGRCRRLLWSVGLPTPFRPTPRLRQTAAAAKAAAVQVAVCLNEGTMSSKSPDGHRGNRI